MVKEKVETDRSVNTHGTVWMLLFCLQVAAAGCGDELVVPTEPTPPQDTVTGLSVSLTVWPEKMVPGMSSIITATASIADTDRLVLFNLSVDGLGGDTLINLPILGKGSQTFTLQFSIPNAPIAGVLDFTAVARTPASVDTAHASLTIVDDGPPWILTTAPDTLALTKALELKYGAGDAAGIIRLTFRVRGIVERDTVLVLDHAPNVSGVFQVPIPDWALPGDSVSFRVTALDGFRQSTIDSGVVWLADSTQPNLAVMVDTVFHAGLENADYGLVFFPGDIVRLRIAASDNHSLEWLGYRMLTFGDSTTTPVKNDTVLFEIEIPPGTNTSDPEFRIFAADSSGNVSELKVWAVVMDGIQRPIEAIDVPSGKLGEIDEYVDYVFDVDRDVLYFTDFDYKVHVLGLSPLAELAPIDFSTPVRGLDQIPGTDSLIALVTGSPDRLVSWDKNVGPSAMNSVPVTLPGDCQAFCMQVAANGYALMTGWSPASRSHDTCPLVKVNIRTGEVVTLDVPAVLPHLAGSGDQRNIVAWNYEQAVVYASETDNLGPVKNLFQRLFTAYLAHAGPSLDHTGANVLIRNKLYDSDLTDYRWLLPDPLYNSKAHALSADGRYAYIGNWPGYWKIDVATGAVLEQVILPRIPSQLIPHPDGRRLIVSAWLWMGIVDLL